MDHNNLSLLMYETGSGCMIFQGGGRSSKVWGYSHPESFHISALFYSNLARFKSSEFVLNTKFCWQKGLAGPDLPPPPAAEKFGKR